MSIAYTGASAKEWKPFVRRNVNTAKLERSLPEGQLDLIKVTKGSSVVATKAFTSVKVTYRGGWCEVEGRPEAVEAVLT